MIKILHIVDNLSVDSGVSSVIMNFYRALDKQSYTFDFLVCGCKPQQGNKYVDEITTLGGNVFYVGSPLRIKSFFSSNQKIKRFIKQNVSSYDILHLHAPNLSKFTIQRLKGIDTKKVVIHSHSSMSSPNKIKAFLNAFLSRPCKDSRFNNRIACSSEASSFLFGSKYDQSVFYLKNAIFVNRYLFDENKRFEMRRRFSLDNKIVLLHVSNFSKIKNVTFLIDVFEKINRVSDNYALVLVGEGPEKLNVEKKIKDLSLEKNVLLVGRAANVEDYLSASDIFVLPSLKEGLPVSLVESQTCGLKCLASSSITKEVNLGLVSYSPLIIDDWVSSLLNIKPFDSCERSNFELVKKSRFNINNEISNLEKYYMRIVNANGKGVFKC